MCRWDTFYTSMGVVGKFARANTTLEECGGRLAGDWDGGVRGADSRASPLLQGGARASLLGMGR